MFSHLWGMRVAVIAAVATLLSACRTFSPDGGMDTVATVAGTGLNKDVVQIRSADDAAAVQNASDAIVAPAAQRRRRGSDRAPQQSRSAGGL